MNAFRESPRWLMVADEGLARVLRRCDDGHLEEVQTFTDAAARANEADFRRDARGRRAGGGTLVATHAVSSAGKDGKHLEAEGFARHLCEWLSDSQHAGRFNELGLVAAPRFLGLLRQEMDSHLARVVRFEMDKDLTHETLPQLASRLETQQVYRAPL